MMRRFALLMLMAAGATACATSPRAAGPADNAYAGKIAADAGYQLALLFPAATTQLSLQQKNDTVFGAALVGALREQGFAVLEQDSKRASAVTAHSEAQRAAATELRYSLVQLDDDGRLYGITVSVGPQVLTRVYAGDGTTVSPAGSWVRRE